MGGNNANHITDRNDTQQYRWRASPGEQARIEHITTRFGDNPAMCFQ
jgi:hypothetical protein